MPEIITLLSSLRQCLDGKTWRQLIVITEATLAITRRITMLSISRWAGKGGSYRTIQRFFGALDIPWLQMNWLLSREYLADEDDEILLVADEVVVTKSGKHTFGLNIFFFTATPDAVGNSLFGSERG